MRLGPYAWCLVIQIFIVSSTIRNNKKVNNLHMCHKFPRPQKDSYRKILMRYNYEITTLQDIRGDTIKFNFNSSPPRKKKLIHMCNVAIKFTFYYLKTNIFFLRKIHFIASMLPSIFFCLIK